MPPISPKAEPPLPLPYAPPAFPALLTSGTIELVVVPPIPPPPFTVDIAFVPAPPPFALTKPPKLLNVPGTPFVPPVPTVTK